MKKKLNSKIFTTTVMVGAVIAAPAIVGAIDDASGLNLDGKLGLDKFTNEALAFAGGKGVVGDPFLIATAAELQSITDLNAHYKLTSDIDLIGVSWMPLGKSSTSAFVGSFDGSGFTIKNMEISSVANENIGFVGYLGEGGILKNVTFEKARVASASNGSAAIAVGHFTQSIIDNVHVRDAIIDIGTFNAKVGLGVGSGSNVDGVIKNSSFEGKIESKGNDSVFAGMGMGYIYGKTVVENVSTQGAINLAKSSAVGGLAGSIVGNSSVRNVATNVDIVGQKSIGGLVGKAADNHTFENVVVYGSIQNTLADSVGETAGLFNGAPNKKSLLKNVYVYLRNAEEIEGSNSRNSKYGLVSSDFINEKKKPSISNVKDLFVQSYVNMGGNLGSAGAQEVLTLEEMVDVSKYTPYGMDFENYWMMSKSGPVLKNMPMTPIVNNSPTAFAGGDGSIYNPYVVKTAEQFRLIGRNLDSNFVLGANIDLSSEAYTPIGDEDAPFTGTLDGNGWTISNATRIDQVSSKDWKYMGLFGVIEHGVIKNVKLNGINFTSKFVTSYIPGMQVPAVGLLFGIAANSKFENIQIVNSVAKGDAISSPGIAPFDVGGLGGRVSNDKGTELNRDFSSFDKIRINNAIVTNGAVTGGIIGVVEGKSILGGSEVFMNDIYSNVEVKGGSYTGGIVGSATNTSIRNAVSNGFVEGTSNVGGIIGGVISEVSRQKPNLIENVISYSSIKASTSSASAYAGGIAGSLKSLELRNAFAFNAEIKGHSEGATKTYGTKTKDVIVENLNASPNIITTLSDGEGAKVMDQGAMTSRATYDGLFDFENHWTMSKNNQPILLIESQVSKGSGASNIDENAAYQIIEKMKSIPFDFDINQYQSALEEYYAIEGSKYGALVKPYTEELMRLYHVKLKIDSAVNASKTGISTPKSRALFNVARNMIAVDAGEFDLTAYEEFEKDTYHKIRVAEFYESAVVDATKKVEAAEKSLLDTDIEIAQIAVDAIPDEISAKKELQDRIDAIKNLGFLNENLTKAIEKVNQTMLQEDLAKAEDLFKKVIISADVAKFTPLMTVIRNLVAANEAVKSAETGKTDTKVSTAKTAIGKLSVDHIQYDGLMHRLNVVDVDIAVTLAEDKKTATYIDSAQKKVTPLKDSPEKTAFQDRLDKLKALIEAGKALDEATKAVEDAEKSKSEDDIKDAQDKINTLPESDEKDALQDRLDKVKDEAGGSSALDEAIKAVEEAEKSKSESDIKNAQDKIDALPDGKDKDDLQNRLDKVKSENEKNVLFQTLSNEVKAINKGILDDVIKPAKFPATREELESIRQGGEALIDVVQKSQLGILIDATLALINLVDKIEGGDKTLETIGQLPNSKIKDKYLAELAEKDALAAAEKAVVQAEELKTKASIANAKDKVNVLRPSSEKTALLKRIAALEKENYEQGQMDIFYKHALEAVEKAEASLVVAYLNTAIKLVDKVSDADERKQGLVIRIKTIQLRNQIASVDAELGRLESRPSQSGVAKVQGSINKLDATVNEREAFQNRLDAVKQKIHNGNYSKDYAKALKAVEFAESAKIQSKRVAYNSALPSVDVLLDSELKVDLEKRLAKVLAEAEGYEKLDGDYKPGDSVVKAAQSIKDDKVKSSLLAWAKAVEDAEVYNSSVLLKALTKAQQAVPQEILDNAKYADLIEELTQRTVHVKESSKVFSSLTARGVIKKVYVAMLKFEGDRTEVNKKAAEALINDLKRFKGHEGQVEKLFERLNRIEVVAK